MSEVHTQNPGFISIKPKLTKRKLYLFWWLMANILNWGLALTYLHLRPTTYTSKWSINLPASLPNINVSVPNIGQASSWNESPYKSFADPRENYKFLVESDEFIENVANQLNIPVEKFKKPRIKIIHNTTLIQLEIKGDTPEDARKKALTLHNALEKTISKLRAQEAAQQERNLKVALSDDEQKLKVSKQRLYQYKERSELNSKEQLQSITSNLESLRQQYSESIAQLKEITAQVNQLSSNLGLSTQDVADALRLQSDKLFQQYLANYSQTNAELLNLSAKYLPSNPTVITKKEAKYAEQNALIKQAKIVLGKSMSLASLQRLIVSGGGSSVSSSEQAHLFQELISLRTRQQGMQAHSQELKQQIKQLDSRLKKLSQEQLKLDNLERDVKVAEAIFTSNMTKLNLKKSDISSSYPEIAMVMPPTLAKDPSNPKPIFVILGSVICSVLLSTGTAFLILRIKEAEQKNTILRDFNNKTNNLENNQSNNYSHVKSQQ